MKKLLCYSAIACIFMSYLGNAVNLFISLPITEAFKEFAIMNILYVFIFFLLFFITQLYDIFVNADV
jgi:hypothetical protein